jgi:hypothetical protein
MQYKSSRIWLDYDDFRRNPLKMAGNNLGVIMGRPMTSEEARMLKPGDRLREGQYTFWKVQAVTAQGAELWSVHRNTRMVLLWANPLWADLVLFHKGAEGKPWWDRLLDPT